jgi:hypothetical protein
VQRRYLPIVARKMGVFEGTFAARSEMR